MNQPMKPGIEQGKDQTISFVYKNHEGVVSRRSVIPLAIAFMTTDHYPEQQWIMRAWCKDREDHRYFALRNIVGVGPNLNSADVNIDIDLPALPENLTLIQCLEKEIEVAMRFFGYRRGIFSKGDKVTLRFEKAS